MMYEAKVLFQSGKLMVQSRGNSKRQAERNAGVEGLRYLESHEELKITP
jgi:hypothetical protein